MLLGLTIYVVKIYNGGGMCSLVYSVCVYFFFFPLWVCLTVVINGHLTLLFISFRSVRLGDLVALVMSHLFQLKMLRLMELLNFIVAWNGPLLFCSCYLTGEYIFIHVYSSLMIDILPASDCIVKWTLPGQ